MTLRANQPIFTRGANGQLIMTCRTLEELPSLAVALASVLEAGDIVLLQGELGAGKTTLTQFLAQALGVDSDQYVASPSFALMHEYSGRLPVFHMDLYRLSGEEDVELAGLTDFFEHRGVCVVEWPDRLGSLTPADRLDIHIEHAEYAPPAARRLTLTPQGLVWRQKIDRMAESLGKAGN
jgi:tRNA threonylcarbamoyladenosine biosynthesis protein TsaE